jgi:hypothetical protein
MGCPESLCIGAHGVPVGLTHLELGSAGPLTETLDLSAPTCSCDVAPWLSEDWCRTTQQRSKLQHSPDPESRNLWSCVT